MHGCKIEAGCHGVATISLRIYGTKYRYMYGGKKEKEWDPSVRGINNLIGAILQN